MKIFTVVEWLHVKPIIAHARDPFASYLCQYFLIVTKVPFEFCHLCAWLV